MFLWSGLLNISQIIALTNNNIGCCFNPRFVFAPRTVNVCILRRLHSTYKVKGLSHHRYVYFSIQFDGVEYMFFFQDSQHDSRTITLLEHQHFGKANINSKENAKRKSIYGLAFSIQIQCLRTWTFAVYVPCKNLTKSKCIARKNLTCNLFIVLALEV